MNSTFLSGEKESSFLCKIYILFKFFLELPSRQFKKKNRLWTNSFPQYAMWLSSHQLFLSTAVYLNFQRRLGVPRKIVFNQNPQIEKCKRVNKNYKLLLNLLRKQILCCLFVNVAVLLATKFGNALVTSSYVDRSTTPPLPPKKFVSVYHLLDHFIFKTLITSVILGKWFTEMNTIFIFQWPRF